MGVNTLRIPVISIQTETALISDSIERVIIAIDDKDIIEFIEETFDIKDYSDLAYLLMLDTDGTGVFEPIMAVWLKVNPTNDVHHYHLEVVDKLDRNSFEVEYGFDFELGEDIPKYIIINN